MNDRVRFTVEGAIGRMTLARPGAHNAIDDRMVLALGAAVGEAEAAGGLRALLVDAEGPSFTVGGDLVHLAEQAHRLGEELGDMIGPFHDALARLAELPLPVVCAARGPVAGGGIGLLWASDVVLASETIRIAPGFPRLGLSGDGGSTWYLPRLVGLRRAQDILMRNRLVEAEEALALGLVTEVVGDDDLDDAALAAVQAFAEGPTASLAEQRALLRGSFERSLREGLAAETAAMIRCGATADAPPAVRAFAARERPAFAGR